MSKLVDLCISCGTAKIHAGEGIEWEGKGDWGDFCKLCGSPVITCRPEEIQQVLDRNR